MLEQERKTHAIIFTVSPYLNIRCKIGKEPISVCGEWQLISYIQKCMYINYTMRIELN